MILDGRATDSRVAARVELEDVHLSYGDHTVLTGISFTVQAGEIVCVLGGSGVGKSTILRLILRLIEPDQGRILVNGMDICRASNQEVLRLRERMGMVFQGSALFDSLPVYDNVAFPLREHSHRDESAIRERVFEVLRFVDLEPEAVAWLLPAELSGGMKKRVAIARALANEPEILLFDEPTSGLDPVTTRTIDELILKLRRELGVCAVVVTHDIESATRIATRIALLLDSHIVAMGTPGELRASGHAYVREFLG